jgi:hypothetical protein
LLGAALVVVGCGDDKDPGQTNSATNNTNNTNNTNATDETQGGSVTGNVNPTTDGTTGVDGTTGAPVTTSGPDTTGGTTMSFIMPKDGGGGVKECDIWAQDCPPGEKCMPWDNSGSGSWNSTKCTPVNANPGGEGDDCTVEGSGVSGVDTCDVGKLCWYLDENNAGKCIDMCTGSPDNGQCDDGQICDVSNDGVLILCLTECDPLVQSCDEGQICFYSPFSQTFICDFDASGEMGAYGDPCAYINVCDYGLFCASPESLPPGECDSTDGCCTPYCNLMEPNNCPGAMGGQECVPWYNMGEAPPGQENIGACAVPA